MKKLLLPILGILMGAMGMAQVVDSAYNIDSVYTYPDVREETFSAKATNAQALFTIVEEHSYMALIYKKDTIHFKALGVLTSPSQDDTVYYMQRYTIGNMSTNKQYKLNLMFYTKNDALVAIGIVDEWALTMFNIKQ